MSDSAIPGGLDRPTAYRDALGYLCYEPPAGLRISAGRPGPIRWWEGLPVTRKSDQLPLWTRPEVALLARNLGRLPIAAIADALERDWSAVYKKTQQLRTLWGNRLERYPYPDDLAAAPLLAAPAD